jgi:hypothetical protein
MPDQQESREIADRRRSGVDEAFDAEKRLMLLRRQSLPFCGRFAEREEYAQLVAKLGECLVVDPIGFAVPLGFRDA